MSESLPPPRDLGAPVRVLVVELADRLGSPAAVAVCLDLLGGADREDHLDVLPYLTGFTFAPGDPTLDREVWKDYWPRTWGARGLLYAWSEEATPAVVAGLDDEHWRPAEMCLKVATKHELGQAGPAAAGLAGAALPRVRAQVARCLGVVGDTEHVGAVRLLLDDADEGVRRQAAKALESMTERLDLPGT